MADFCVNITNVMLSLRRSGLLAGLVAAECARRGELAQSVADHVFGNVDRHVAASVVNCDRMSNHLREDHRSAAPGADDFLFIFLVHGLNSFKQFRFNERAFF